VAAYNVVIIVPSQGKDVGAFQTVAQALARKVYGGRARIIRTQVSVVGAAAATVAFSKLDGGDFSWDCAHHLRSVLTISHGFSGDGPNLAYGLEDERYQAWGCDPEDPSVLGAEGRKFWGRDVKNAMADSGKIILVGCFMGSADYARNVAKAALD
jgi:hypothetical protein